jgi:predicted nuclease of restriction endonuclease-like RecB superfamily
MLTGNLVRVRHARNLIVPYYLDADDPQWLAAAEQLLELFRGQNGRTRGELEDDLADTFGAQNGQLVIRGLAKLLEDRCEFEVVSGHPPDQLRALVFQAATLQRQSADTLTDAHGIARLRPFDRNEVLEHVGRELGLSAEQVDAGLFADLKSEQRLIAFQDIAPERLLQRYNVALAQAVLMRSTRVHVAIRREPPQRYRQLLRLVKFHRLICEIERSGDHACQLHLDGPLSLFSATQKYGLQLALFLPAVLLCRDFELRADLNWGAQRKPKTFTINSGNGLVSHNADTGMFIPPELGMFVELFRKKIEGWQIDQESEVFPLGDGFWVPDFRLTHTASGRSVYLEVLGFWRKSSAEAHLRRLREHASEPFLLAVSDSLRIEEEELEGLPAGVHRFRQMPLPDEVVKLAEQLVQSEC